jgi:Fe-S-cluster containining protein
MTEFSKFVLLTNSDAANDFDSQWKKIPLEFDIFNEHISLTIAVENKNARLSDIVPLARQISQMVGSIELDNVKESGYGIPCAKGCSACCSYLVPVSVPEIFRLKEQVGSMPVDQQRMILRSCLLASRNLLGKMIPKLFLTKKTSDNSPDTKTISNWYSNLKQVCPFLFKSQCTIYDIRPIACSEYFIKGSSRACKSGKGKAHVIQLPVSMVEVLGRLTSRLENTSVEAVMLPLAPAWWQENEQRQNRSWPAELMADVFVEIIEQIALDNQHVTSCQNVTV